jgi:hypothetical protein
MAESLKKYKLIIIVLGFIALAAFITFTMLSKKNDKIPSKGVFVMDMQDYYNI